MGLALSHREGEDSESSLQTPELVLAQAGCKALGERGILVPGACRQCLAILCLSPISLTWPNNPERRR